MDKLQQDFADLLIELDEAGAEFLLVGFDLIGHAIPYIGKAALIRNKRAASRHKDLADVEELERGGE